MGIYGVPSAPCSAQVRIARYAVIRSHPQHAQKPSPPKVRVQVNGITYSLRPYMYPRIRDFLRYASPDSAAPRILVWEEGISLFNVAYVGVEDGFRRCFHLLQGSVDDYANLCSTLHKLGVDVLTGRHFRQIHAEVLCAKRNQHEVAQDSAFGLIYLLWTQRFEPAFNAERLAFNPTILILSEENYFDNHIRTIVKTAYERTFPASREWKSAIDRAFFD